MPDMKVRIGIGMGGWPFPERHASAFYDFISLCDDVGVDSLWLSDRVTGPGGFLDPTVTMAAIAARSRKMKLGTSAITLPVRNPVVLAKELATLDFLSNGRLLLVVGIGREVPGDHYGVLLSYALADSTQEAREMAEKSFVPRRGDVPAESYSAFGTPDDILARISEYRAVGVTKFVFRPACAPEQWVSQVEALAKEVIAPVQTPFTQEELLERAGLRAPD